MKTWKIAAAAALLLSGSVSAQDSLSSGFFAGTTIGWSKHTVGASNYEDESGSAVAVGLNGGYRYNANWSVLVDYSKYGQADLFDFNYAGVPITVASDTKGLSVMGQYLTGHQVGEWAVGARLGLISWQTDVNFKSGSNELTFDDDSGVSVIGGLLASYSATENLDLLLSADWFVYDHDAALLTNAAIDFQHSRVGVTLQYNF